MESVALRIAFFMVGEIEPSYVPVLGTRLPLNTVPVRIDPVHRQA